MYELIAKLVYDEMNNYRCIKKEYIGTVHTCYRCREVLLDSSTKPNKSYLIIAGATKPNKSYLIIALAAKPIQVLYGIYLIVAGQLLVEFIVGARALTGGAAVLPLAQLFVEPRCPGVGGVVVPPTGQAGQRHSAPPLVHQGGVTCNH